MVMVVDVVVGSGAGQLRALRLLLSFKGGVVMAVAKAARESNQTEGITTIVKREQCGRTMR